MPTKKKVVLLHDWLVGFRGGERVLEALCELYPDAPIYTLVHKKGSTSPVIESREIVTSFLDNIPGIHQKYRTFLPIMPLAVEKMKIHHDADLVISSCHCVIKGIRKPEGAKHLSYIHSPMRYMYDQFENYFGNSPLHMKLAAHLIRPYLQFWDRCSNEGVDKFLVNSEFVQNRVSHLYHKKSEVINPFVDLKDFNNRPQVKKENYFVMVTAFSANKRLDLAIKAFNENGLPLKIIGGGSVSEERELKALAKSNIEFLGKVGREEIVSYLSRARALIFPGVEDFGIVPLESLAAGTPLIAFAEGGVLETMTPETCVFFDSPDTDSLNSAIMTFGKKSFNPELLKARAADFSKERFTTGIKAAVQDLLGPR